MNSRWFFLGTLWLIWPSMLLCWAAELPQLHVTNQPPNVIVSWPESGRWVLEESTQLHSAVPWTMVPPASYGSNAALRFVSLPNVEGNRFFRLRRVSLTVPSLKGYWGLDEGNGQASQDGTEYGSALLLTNTTWGTGRVGPGALRFNGSPAGPGASRAWVSNDAYRVLPPPGAPFSLSFWLNPDALPLGWQSLAGNNTTGTNGWQVALHNAGPGTNFFVFSSAGLPSSLSITGRFLLLPGQWHQLTLTHDGTQGAIYLDSAELARGVGALQTHDGPLHFGGGVGVLNSFLGRIDDLRIYTNALSHEQISLTGHWTFDETNDLICADSSIQGNLAIISNTTARVAGHTGNAIDLGKTQIRIGNQDYAVFPPNGGSFSFSFRLRPNSLPAGSQGLMKLGEGPIGGWELTTLTEASGETRLALTSTNTGGTLDLLARVPLAANTWTKIDITFNGGIATLYANGKQILAKNGAIRGTKAPLVIGAVPGLPNFDGLIDDLKVYSRERGPSEIGPLAATMWETVMWNSSTNMQLQGSGPPGKTLTYTIVPVITPTNGTVTLAPGSSQFTYIAGSRKGPDAFTYTVSDGEFTSDPAIVTMSVVQPHYLSPTGGWLQPLDGSTPMQAWLAGPADAMDAILKTNNYYDCFFYAPGEYQTRGWKYLERKTANTGCKHIGSGMDGPTKTTVKLVDIWSRWAEEVIFGIDAHYLCDGFEIHNMVLDCNATNLPKYVLGEPVIVSIPLTNTTRVETVTLRWANKSFSASTFAHIGRAVEFTLRAVRAGTNTFVTNCNFTAITEQTSILPIGTEADQLLLELTRRAAGVDFYGLTEIEITGNKPSLPGATKLNGEDSRLNNDHPIIAAVDGNRETAWASGPEQQVEIALPLEPGSKLDQITFEWNCKNLVESGRLGPASTYTIRARDEFSKTYFDVPFFSMGQGSNGTEHTILGTSLSNTVIQTDQLLITLTAKESSIDFYSLKEIRLQNGRVPVPMRLPSASGTLNWYLTTHVLQAFDGNNLTQWACDIQGMVGAIKASGNNQKFTRLNVKGFGTKVGRECFPAFLGVFRSPEETRHIGNVRVEDCLFSESAPTNSDGLTAIVLAAAHPDSLTNAIVRRCTVADLRNHFSYSQGMTASYVENCTVTNCSRGVYFEPHPINGESAGAVLVVSNQFLNVDYGVLLSMYPRTGFDSITCLNNEIVLGAGSPGWGIGACDTCFGGESAVVTNMTALNNIIRYTGWTENANRSDVGLFYSDIPHAIFGNNIVVVAHANGLRVRTYPAAYIYPQPPVEDCDHPGPFQPGDPVYTPSVDDLRVGYRRAWFNNRNLSGDTLEVRYRYFGSDSSASQQQWPTPFPSP